MANMLYTFTSESVCAGHPDKMCDQVSDAILDEVLKQDPKGRVAVETMVASDHAFICGEVTTKAKINYENIARKQIKKLGYVNGHYNFSYKSPIDIIVHTQSPDIARGVDNDGAGDQGMMFGFACKETKELMPAPIAIANRFAQKIDEVRENKILKYLHPDGKTQVTIEYENDKPKKVLDIVLAVPHQKKVKLDKIKKDLIKYIVDPVLHEYKLKYDKKNVIVNGAGEWLLGGPASDTGVTGRKIVVDTYGGYARVGGGAFSGKDPTKVDRSGAYAARYLAKNIVANGLADKAEVRLAYFIGAKRPLMQEVETFNTEKVSKKIIDDFINKILDTSVAGILNTLNLRQPIYLSTAAYGHFGRSQFPWEKVVKL